MNSIGIAPRPAKMDSASERIGSQRLQIAMCPPELHLLQRVINGETADATFIIQGYIAEGLADRGHKVSFLGPYDYSGGTICSGELDMLKPARRTWTNGPLFEFASKAVWRVQRILGIPFLNMFSNLRLMDACMQSLPGDDVVYERNTMYRFGVAMACKQLAIPYILYVEADDILEHDIMKKPITGLLRLQLGMAFRYNLHAADRVICVSEPLKAHLVTKWKVHAEKIVVFPNVADIRRFRPDPNARANVRRTMSIGNSPLVLFVGNFYEWHDVACLLKAFALVLDIYPQARLILVGDGAKRQAMSELAVELGIDRTVIFTGMVAHADVPRYMAAADIAVVPYPALHQDLWLSPLKLFEYMSAGKAIVASALGQIMDVIEDGRNGLLVPPGEVSAMSKALLKLIKDGDLRTKLGAEARIDAVQRFSWGSYLSRLEGVFEAVVAHQPVSGL